jgi:hypothetical protein
MRILMATALLVACGKPIDVEPEVPSQVPENLAPPVDGTADDPYPENELSIVCGEGTLEEESLDYNWCHARAWVQSPILDVIDAALQPRVAVDFCNAEYTTVTEDADPSATWSVEIHHIARSDLANIEYDVRWVCDPIEERGGEPSTILCTFGMIEGQTLFPYFEGSIAMIVPEGETDVVEWQYIEHLQAPTTDQAMIEQTIRDVYGDMLAFLAGESYPDCPE